MALSLSGFITRFKRFILDSLERGRAPAKIETQSVTHSQSHKNKPDGRLPLNRCVIAKSSAFALAR